jgi:hypothetical protein
MDGGPEIESVVEQERERASHTGTSGRHRESSQSRSTETHAD